MAEISTLKGTFDLVDAAYGIGVKLGSGAKNLEQERHCREAVYGYFITRPRELELLVNNGFLKPEEIGAPARAAR